MNHFVRNAVLFVGVMITWVFFFIPNPILSFLNVVQLQARLPNLILFVLVPVALALLLMLVMAGSLSTRLVLTLCVPALGVAASLVLWGIGIYSDESLLGAWLYVLTPIAAYSVAAVVAILVLRRKQLPATGFPRGS